MEKAHHPNLISTSAALVFAIILAGSFTSTAAFDAFPGPQSPEKDEKRIYLDEATDKAGKVNLHQKPTFQEDIRGEHAWSFVPGEDFSLSSDWKGWDENRKENPLCIKKADPNEHELRQYSRLDMKTPEFPPPLRGEGPDGGEWGAEISNRILSISRPGASGVHLAAIAKERRGGAGGRVCGWTLNNYVIHETFFQNEQKTGSSNRDWKGIARDTETFLILQPIIDGVYYLIPDSKSNYTAEEKKISWNKYVHNIRSPVFDADPFWVNYIGHPYWGATFYIRGRERGFTGWESFAYSALLSTFF